MISIYAFSLLLWICLTVQASASSSDMVIDSVERTESADAFTLTAKYHGTPLQRNAVWWTYNGLKHRILKNGTVNGVASLVFNKAEGDQISLWLGDVHHHFVEFKWNVRDQGSTSATLNYDLSTIDPDKDVIIPINAGQPAIVKITSNTNRGAGHLLVEENNIPMMYAESTTYTGVVSIYEGPTFIKVETTEENGKMTTTMEFKEGTAEGHYFCVASNTPKERRQSPLEWIEEYIVLKAHEEGKGVSFLNSHADALVS